MIHRPHQDARGYSGCHVVKIPAVLGGGTDGSNELAPLLQSHAIVWGLVGGGLGWTFSGPQASLSDKWHSQSLIPLYPCNKS